MIHQAPPEGLFFVDDLHLARDGEGWTRGVQIAHALGYRNARRAVRDLSDALNARDPEVLIVGGMGRHGGRAIHPKLGTGVFVA